MAALERDQLGTGVLMQHKTAGFSLIEIVIALVILSLVLLMLPVAGLNFTRTVFDSRRRNEANALADAWIARCRQDPNYDALDSIGTGKCRGTVNNLGTMNFTRTTTVAQDAAVSGVANNLNDYKRVTVVVTGGGLTAPVSRTITLARP